MHVWILIEHIFVVCDPHNGHLSTSPLLNITKTHGHISICLLCVPVCHDCMNTSPVLNITRIQGCSHLYSQVYSGLLWPVITYARHQLYFSFRIQNGPIGDQVFAGKKNPGELGQKIPWHNTRRRFSSNQATVGTFPPNMPSIGNSKFIQNYSPW